jgi:Fe-S oxidoreductase
MISKGLINQARAAARETVGRLYPYAEKGIPIIGLEPSCLLTLRDEYLYLLPEDPRARIVAEQSVMFEEFIKDLMQHGDLKIELERLDGDILLHGHCHQKSLVGTGPSKELLALTGAKVREVDSGCCGMAGSFGYEVEHYEISMKMGERKLLPAVRENAEETMIVAAGVSCRAKSAHGTDKQAYHPAEILSKLMQQT